MRRHLWGTQSWNKSYKLVLLFYWRKWCDGLRFTYKERWGTQPWRKQALHFILQQETMYSTDSWKGKKVVNNDFVSKKLPNPFCGVNNKLSFYDDNFVLCSQQVDCQGISTKYKEDNVSVFNYGQKTKTKNVKIQEKETWKCHNYQI